MEPFFIFNGTTRKTSLTINIKIVNHFNLKNMPNEIQIETNQNSDKLLTLRL